MSSGRIACVRAARKSARRQPPTSPPPPHCPAARGANRLHHSSSAHAVPDPLDAPEGTGAPAKVDKLVVHYKGTLADGGAVFDDSRERGHAFTFALGCNKVIRGWDEALVGATKGARFTVRIPSADAYGPKGAPPRIPPNADLVFDLELLNINETLVEEGMRFRQEEEARVQKFLAVQDDERRAEAAGGGGGGRKAAKRSRSDDGGSGSDSDSSSSSESSGARRRRKEKKRKKKERKKERRKEKKEKKEKKSKKSKKKRHKSQSES